MEGGGERKRKANGPLKLDWDIVYPTDRNDNDVSLPVVVKAAAAAEKPRLAVLDDGEEESMDKCIKQKPDAELIEKVNRLKASLGKMSSRLSDGGEKLRANLKKHEAELERRKLLKADDRCKRSNPLADESTCNGATQYSSPVGAPLSVPASQSVFGARFCSNLDDKRGTMFSREEVSPLHRCDQRNTRKNRQLPTQETQKMCSSSRQTPFISPSLLSLKTDKPPQADTEQSGSGSSSPSTHLSDEDVPVCFAKKENALRFQPTRNCRRNNKTVVPVDEEELEIVEPVHADKVDLSKNETQIYYPSRDDPEAVLVCYSDMECLAPESYLSSQIMNFYIRYLQKPTSPTPRNRCDCHFFNTYFYERWKSILKEIDKDSSYMKLRRWWKGVNIFEKAYIFIPIHETVHWSLIIICMPNKEDQSGPIILHLDSLGMHVSRSIFNNVKSFLVEEWKFLRQGEVLRELPIADIIWSRLSRKIDYKVIEVPQQKNEYDCGLFVLYFMERFIEEAPERLKKEDLEMFGRQWFRPEEASALRQKIHNLLKEVFENTNKDTCELSP